MPPCSGGRHCAYLDLSKADDDGSSGGEPLNDRAGDEIQQEPWQPEGNEGPAPVPLVLEGRLGVGWENG